MGIYGHILKNWELHNLEKVFADAATVCSRIDVIFRYGNVKYYSEDGEFKHTSVGIIDDKVGISEDNKQFILNIQAVNLEDIALGLDTDLDYLIPNKRLCSLAYIEKVRNDNTELIFRFAYEYLKLNPDEYFWFEWNYAFSWEDMQKLNKLPFDKNWCFRNP